jgi:hypothetical protein
MNTVLLLFIDPNIVIKRYGLMENKNDFIDISWNNIWGENLRTGNMFTISMMIPLITELKIYKFYQILSIKN